MRIRVRRLGALLASAAFLTASLLTVFAPAEAALASTDPYTGLKSPYGLDVSYPDCTKTVPSTSDSTAYSFAIVGVTGGKAFTTNSCLGSEFINASKLSVVSLYMNLNYPIGTTAPQGSSGPAGTCAKADKSCRAYNYGYNAAQAADQYATSEGASATTWWLDVETANSWSAKPDLNYRVIQGAIDYFSSTGRTVGIYSTPSMWQKIAGSNRPNVPAWVAGASSLSNASSLCSSSFTGDPVWLVQFFNRTLNYDQDYACP